MDCPACGTGYVGRPGGENLTVVACPSCRRLPLWWVGVLAVAALLVRWLARPGALLRVAAASVGRAGARVVAAFPRTPAP